ncbi:GFA family protein [Altererythrobacter sp. SALINAS58]|uniref:GFA family protein n=1 Tax=Alteripontixanthobacter muriae TaxID=2705546 RepID=UPI00157569A6|nr:GFA family protein [Alteripontixanthobacter muriae]NTZ41584.1 GFA family protein [Alteripontixanthobacter muriae]
MTATTGRCLCGAISYSASGPAEHHALCHCSDCRHWAGAPVVGWIAFQEADLSIEGSPATYRSSEHGMREFCGNCGTGLFYRNAEMLPGIVDIQSGTLDDMAAHAPTAQIMVKERVEWVQAMTELPEFQTYPGMD